jgi:hypothetical protein
MMVSIGTMIEQIGGLVDTKDLTPFEQQFAASILEKYLRANKNTQGFSDKQVEIVESIWSKSFAG